MSQDFMALYRQLCRERIDDNTFQKEREDVLRVLGYDVGDPALPVAKSKNHGKAPRRFAQERRLKAISTDLKSEGFNNFS